MSQRTQTKNPDKEPRQRTQTKALAERTWPREPGQGQTRLGRIGDRSIPWPVASPQSQPPFLPATTLEPNRRSLFNHWTSE